MPKYGLSKKLARFDSVNMGRVVYGIRKGWLDPNELITIKSLVDAGLIDRPKFGLKLLTRVAEQ